jgi:hypothetical protein
MALAYCQPKRLIVDYLADPALCYGLLLYTILVTLWATKNWLAFRLSGTATLPTMIPIPLPRVLPLASVHCLFCEATRPLASHEG